MPILISSYNKKKDIKVSENSVKNFSDAHPPLKLCKDRTRVVTCGKKFSPWFGVGYDLYPTSCVFSILRIRSRCRAWS